MLQSVKRGLLEFGDETLQGNTSVQFRHSFSKSGPALNCFNTGTSCSQASEAGAVPERDAVSTFSCICGSCWQAGVKLPHAFVLLRRAISAPAISFDPSIDAGYFTAFGLRHDGPEDLPAVLMTYSELSIADHLRIVWQASLVVIWWRHTGSRVTSLTSTSSPTIAAATRSPSGAFDFCFAFECSQADSIWSFVPSSLSCRPLDLINPTVPFLGSRQRSFTL